MGRARAVKLTVFDLDPVDRVASWIASMRCTMADLARAGADPWAETDGHVHGGARWPAGRRAIIMSCMDPAEQSRSRPGSRAGNYSVVS